MEKTIVPMGIGPLSNAIICRTFRWFIDSEDFSRYEVAAASFDYVNDTIKLRFTDAIFSSEGLNGLRWAESLKNKTNKNPITFSTVDGCGVVLYSITYHGLTLLHHNQHFDYNVSDVSTREVVVKFKDYEIKYTCQGGKKFEDEYDKTQPYLQKFVPAKNMETEETKITVLNQTISVPTKQVKAKKKKV